LRVTLGVVLATALGARAVGADVAGDALDSLVVRQRPAGGWTFASPPGTRPVPFTLVVQTAERLLAPLGLATWDLVVVRSPGTPAAGLVLIEGYRRTGRDAYLEAARRAGDFLVATQLRHGGWFSELPVDGAETPWWFRVATDTRPMLDDDVTPGAIRFLLELWAASGDERYRAAAEKGIELIVDAQLESGAWPLDARPSWLRRLRPHYEDQPALNDGATPLAITTLVAATSMLGRPELLVAARRAGDWLVSVQGAAPHAGWAQQYTAAGAPASARRFELPALVTWETRHAIEALLALADATGDRRYCTSAVAAARWLDRVRVGPTCWARFHDLEGGAPIFVDADGRRVATSAMARPGYGWMGEFGIPWVLARLGIEAGTPPHRLPGDPGSCAEDPGPPTPLTGARGLAAEAAIALATSDVAAASPCATTPPPDAALRPIAGPRETPR
jgi:hypothetical protein